MVSIFIASLFGIVAVQASPALFSRQSITPLSTSQVNSYTPFINFAKATYCPVTAINAWNCGAACAGNSDFEVTASGGDGSDIQQWYVGYSPGLSSVVVAHQGTNTSQATALVTDAHVTKGPLDKSLFPQIPDGVEVHKGFRDEHVKTALAVLSAVQSTMSKYKTSSVTLVGHSLGAALAVLDAAFLHGRLPSSTTITTITYGLPRVGNKDFADYVDANVPITHITNKQDPVPVTPPITLGYQQPSGEIHITEEGTWGNCPGQENPSTQCSDGAVPDILKGVRADHDGPYNGITLGRCW